MFGVIALACFDVVGIAFMLYVLVNLHRESRRARNGSNHLQPTRVAARNKAFNSLNASHYSAYDTSSTPKRTSVAGWHGAFHGRPETVLRRTSR